MTATMLLTLMLVAADDPIAAHFSSVEIEKEFLPYLSANRLLMEVSGVKVIRLKNGKNVVMSVASTAIKDGSAADMLRAEKVCRIKALANVVAEKQGVQVAHSEELNEKTVVTLVNGEEKAESLSELLQTTKTKVEGIANDMPVIGRWRSKDGQVLYYAIGAMLEADGM